MLIEKPSTAQRTQPLKNDHTKISIADIYYFIHMNRTGSITARRKTRVHIGMGSRRSVSVQRDATPRVFAHRRLSTAPRGATIGPLLEISERIVWKSVVVTHDTDGERHIVPA